MVAQASTGLIETWWVSRLGIDALAGLALVFPGFMLMQMLSAGAMGGGISSSIARAHSFSFLKLPQFAGLPVRSTLRKSLHTGRSFSDA